MLPVRQTVFVLPYDWSPRWGGKPPSVIETLHTDIEQKCSVENCILDLKFDADNTQVVCLCKRFTVNLLPHRNQASWTSLFEVNECFNEDNFYFQLSLVCLVPCVYLSACLPTWIWFNLKNKQKFNSMNSDESHKNLILRFKSLIAVYNQDKSLIADLDLRFRAWLSKKCV